MTERGPQPFLSPSNEYVLDAASLAYRILSYFIRDLRKKLATEPPREASEGSANQNSQSSPRNTLALPSSASIPFTEFMDLPVPFSDNNVLKLFTTCHLRRMSDPGFLQDGSEWCGYYSLPYPHAEVDFDPPMHGIRFTTAAASNDSRLIEIEGTGGIDSVGAFKLRGTIDIDIGVLNMDKLYTSDGPRWGWVGFLTPFGIIASWGARNHGSGGWVWLYKRAWCTS
ncbi:MAG: hypothetical protein Q9226_008915 [Calogaya cf. arnoldii]